MLLGAVLLGADALVTVPPRWDAQWPRKRTRTATRCFVEPAVSSSYDDQEILEVPGATEPTEATEATDGTHAVPHSCDTTTGLLARSQFPFFADAPGPDGYGGRDWVFLENAGGSQVPRCVIDATSQALARRWRVEAGREHVRAARSIADHILGVQGTGQVVLGGSTSALLRSLASAYADKLEPGDEVVVCEWSHEAHIAPWIWAAQRAGAVVKWWRLDPDLNVPEASTLEPLLSPGKTKVVAATHVSNVLGTIMDVATAADLAHTAGAEIVVDGVALMAHHEPDVARLQVDWYVFSCYKVYGPHLAALYGSHGALRSLASAAPNHDFVQPGSVGPPRWELGTVNQEAAAGLGALGTYLAFLAGVTGADTADASSSASDVVLNRSVVQAAYRKMALAEQAPATLLLDYLQSRPKARILGLPTMQGRVPTISVTHASLTPTDLCAAMRNAKIVCRHGNFLAPRLLRAQGLRDVEDGALRFSLVHYNTVDDIDRLITALDAAGF